MNNGNVSFSIAVCQMIRQPIVVQIAEVSTHTCKGGPFVVVGHARLKTYLFKSLSTEVMKQEIRAVVVGHKDVEKAVAVVIGKDDSHSLSQHG